MRPTQILFPKLLWYQKPVVKALEDDSTKYVTFLASRRIGKSLIAKCMAIKWCLKKRCNVGFVVPTGDLARKFIREIIETLKGSGAVSSSNTVDKFITFVNGSMIYFHSSEAFSRGAGNYKYMIFDECAYLDTDTYRAVFQPMTMEADKCYFASTPNTSTGIFYDLYNRGLDDRRRYKSFSCNLEESGLYDAQTIAEIKETTPNRIYLQEYMCEFLDAGGVSAFTNWNDRLMSQPGERTKNLYAGIDFSGASGGTDSTILTIVNDKCEMVALYSYQYGNQKTLDEMADVLTMWNVKHCLAEENSLGAISIDILKKRFKRVTGFVTSNTSKRDIVENVIKMFERGEGGILDTPQVRLQFGNFVQDFTKGGKITYHNLNSNIHDDIPISYCLACWNCRNRRGQYLIA